MTYVTFENGLVRVDSEPLDAAAAAVVLAGTRVRHLPAKATDPGDGSVRLTVELPCDSAYLEGGRTASERRALTLLADALRASQHRHDATAQPLDGSLTGGDVDPDLENTLSTLSRMDRPVTQRGPRSFFLAPTGGEPGMMLEVLDGGFVRLSASAVAVRIPTTACLEAALRFACELNHRLRIARIVAETNAADARPHVRLTAECVVPVAGADVATVLESAAAGVAFARARLAEAARGLVDPTAARIFLDLRGIALEAEDRLKETGSPAPPRAAAP